MGLDVVVVTSNFPSRRIPHKGVFLERDVRGLAARGHRVTCLVGRSRLRDRCGQAADIDGVEVREAPYLSIGYVKPFGPLMGRVAQRNLERALRRLLDDVPGPVDVVYAKFLNAAPLLGHALPGAARVLGVGEGVGSIHNRIEFFPPGRLRRHVEAADVVEVKNDGVAGWMATHWGLGDRLRVVPSGVDAAWFSPGDRAEARRALGLPDDAFVVASVGPRNGNKGGDRVVEACAALGGGVVPLMVGPGWEPAGDAGFVGLGLTGPSGVRTALRAADVFALPSRSEGMPNAVLEALACGLPCVVSDRRFMAFVEHGVEALKVDPDDPAAIGEALASLRDCPERRTAMGAAARARGEALSQERRVDALEALFAEAARAAAERR